MAERQEQPPSEPGSAAAEPEAAEEFCDVDLGTRSEVLPHGAEAPPGLQRYLCYFIHRYLEFRLPEVEALAQAARPPGRWLLCAFLCCVALCSFACGAPAGCARRYEEAGHALCPPQPPLPAPCLLS